MRINWESFASSLREQGIRRIVAVFLIIMLSVVILWSVPSLIVVFRDELLAEPLGELVTHTVARKHHPQLSPVEGLFGFGIIKLKGADTGFLHLLGEFAEGELASGMTVEAVFADEREGSMLDVRYFRPLKGVE